MYNNFMIENITSYIQPIVVEYGALGVFLTTLLEEIIAPIPSPLVPLTAGFFLLPASERFLVIIGQAIIVIALPVAIGVTFGSLAVYGIGYWGGKPFIEKNKKWIGLNWEDLEKTERKLTSGKGDEITLFILRMLPIIPGVAISGFCGIIRYSLKKFVVITFLGTLIRATIMGVVGWFVGSVYLVYVDAISKIEKYILVLLVLFVIFFFMRLIFLKKPR